MGAFVQLPLAGWPAVAQGLSIEVFLSMVLIGGYYRVFRCCIGPQPGSARVVLVQVLQGVEPLTAFWLSLFGGSGVSGLVLLPQRAGALRSRV